MNDIPAWVQWEAVGHLSGWDVYWCRPQVGLPWARMWVGRVATTDEIPAALAAAIFHPTGESPCPTS